MSQRLWLALAGVLLLGFVVAFSARPPVVISIADLDDGLFMKLGQSLAQGRWLGPYNANTLVKGPGFPLFLALNHFLGLAYPLGLAAAYAAAAGFAAAVAARLTRSLPAAVALLAALLFAPILYHTGLIAASREFFYMALTLALVAAAVALATGCLGRPWPMAALVGGLGGWFWLTREEGVWLLPCLALLVAVPLLGRRLAGAEEGQGQDGRRRLAAAGAAFGLAVAIVVGFGLVNWAVYGRFEVNEVKDKAFQGAMSALEDASWPYHQRGVPVPAAARARIYAVSPAFASLKDPLLDGPQHAEVLKWGCRENPVFCRDIGGGWFMWLVRISAEQQGHHQSAAAAHDFYARLAREVRQACADGRLTCSHWPISLIPPMKPQELGDVARSVGRVARVFDFGDPVYLGLVPSDLSAVGARGMVQFLNASTVQGETVPVRLSGWFVAKGDRWISLHAPAPVKLQSFVRYDSADLVSHFKDPRLSRQRFSLEAVCPTESACPVRVTLDGGVVDHIDLNALGVGDHQVAGGTLYVDNVDGDPGGRFLKVRFSRAWLRLAASLNPLYQALVAGGLLAYAGLLGAALVRRRASVNLLVLTGLLGAVLARVLILGLIDALSFRADSVQYALAGVILLVLFSVLSLAELAMLALRWRAAAARSAATATSAP